MDPPGDRPPARGGEASGRARAHVVVSGHVQMVFFRQSTRQEARLRGLAGWVRNLPDGRVEAVFEGAEPLVQELLDWCHQGPPAAEVEQVAVRWEAPQDEPGDFRIR
jgi:acylphosphatase